VTKQSLPSQGTLSLTFVAKQLPSRPVQPLSDPEFHSMWTSQVQAKAMPAPPSLLLQQEPQLSPAMQWAGSGQSGSGLEASWAGSGERVHAVSDGWKLELLQVRWGCWGAGGAAGVAVSNLLIRQRWGRCVALGPVLVAFLFGGCLQQLQQASA
jgi:hypothetical protein